MPSSSRTTFLMIKIFMRGTVCDINRINITALSIRVSVYRSLYLFKVFAKLAYLLLKLSKDPIYLMALLRRNALEVRCISLTSYD